MDPIRPRFIDQISHTNCGPPSEVRKVHDSPYNVRHTSPRSPVICVYFQGPRFTSNTSMCVCVYVCVRVCVCAFDSVAHDILFKVLKLFGFGNSFCSWVKILYTNIRSCVMNGGAFDWLLRYQARGMAGGSIVTITVSVSDWNIGASNKERHYHQWST